MPHVIGELGDAAVTAATPLSLDPNAANIGRQPLDPQTKAHLLAEMPFVSEAFGADMADLGDATPAGKSRRTFRIGLGVALGVAGTIFYLRLARGWKAGRSR